MIVAQIILIAATIGLTVFFLATSGSRSSAIKKIMAILFVVIAIVFIINPTLADGVANLVGIGRGVDLILYGLVFVVALQLIYANVSKREQQKRDAKMVRQISLLEKEIEEIKAQKG